jgi:hypothetical protein
LVTASLTGKLRSAIYTRKSTEEGLEQEFNSLDAQCEAAEPTANWSARLTKRTARTGETEKPHP